VTQQAVSVGIFGGSGFYSFLDEVEEVRLDTPFGPPSDVISVGTVHGVRVAFLPRHGSRHQYPPHLINFRANVWAMRDLGVTQLIGPCASGSLNPHMAPGHFVVCDQFVDRTKARMDTFYQGPIATHVSSADPFCEKMREALIVAGRELGITVHDRGTVVVIEGPRFSTRAESKWFAAMGWDVINMTTYPECHLARELGLCYANVSLVTDYDVGLEELPGVAAVTGAEVIRVFQENNEKLRRLLFQAIPLLVREESSCACPDALEGARLG
jgi:5'-methylthioadenosine phosphorylase